MKSQKPKFPHYHICSNCAKDMGGIMSEGHVCTVIRGQCLYCKVKNKTLIPWVDFNWPRDKDLDKTAKGNRD